MQLILAKDYANLDCVDGNIARELDLRKKCKQNNTLSRTRNKLIKKEREIKRKQGKEKEKVRKEVKEQKTFLKLGPHVTPSISGFLKNLHHHTRLTNNLLVAKSNRLFLNVSFLGLTPVFDFFILKHPCFVLYHHWLHLFHSSKQSLFVMT